MDLALLEVFLAFLFVFLMVGVPWADQIAEAFLIGFGSVTVVPSVEILKPKWLARDSASITMVETLPKPS